MESTKSERSMLLRGKYLSPGINDQVGLIEQKLYREEIVILLTGLMQQVDDILFQIQWSQDNLFLDLVGFHYIVLL